MKFAHIADIHLGYRQYGLQQRYDDFNVAWLNTCQKIAEEQCNFVLLAGDLFHSKDVDPFILGVAQAGLRTMGCPVYAIKGNHDMPKLKQKLDWMGYLRETGYLTLVDTLERGVEHPLRGVNLYGFSWSGYNTNDILKNLPADHDNFSILMVHAGFKQPFGVNINYDLIQNFNYVALGHIHTPLHFNNVHQPGSMETVNAVEAEHPHRGLIIYDNGNIKKLNTTKRPFYRLDEMPDNPDPKAIYDIKHEGTGGFHTIVRTKNLVKPPSPRDNLQNAIKQLTNIAPETVVEIKDHVLTDNPTSAKQVIENAI